jgi:hypothetical protein
MPQGESPDQRQRLITELQGWHTAREAAGRYHRNLLQYAGGIAAVLGIGAGSGGVFAVAGSLARANDESQSLPYWAAIVLMVVAGIAALASVFLMALLIHAFRQRRRAEATADSHLAELIGLRPERFLPSGE